MKKLLSACLVLLCAALLLPAVGALGAVTPVGYPAVVWDDASATPAVSASGTYPRMARLSDGRLLVTHSANVSFSADEGRSWSTTQPLPTPQATALSGAHVLNPANHQPFVLPGMGEDGRDLVMIAYRCDTNGFGASTVGEFYTSLRVVTSRDGGETFGDEIVLIENTCLRRTEEHANDNSIYSSYRGYWEPMPVQTDNDTVLLYYADDLSVEAGKSPWRQQIRYFTYSIASGAWNTDTANNIAIDGSIRTSSTLGSRDGMPAVTKLSDGSFAMVIEAQDYNNRSYIRPDGTKTEKGYARGWSLPLRSPRTAKPGLSRRCAPSPRRPICSRQVTLQAATPAARLILRHCRTAASRSPIRAARTISATAASVCRMSCA